MSRRVFVHLGLPKTGTSYLQGRLWPRRAELRAAGLLLPGREKRDHLLASMVVREDPGVSRRGPGADQAWQVVRTQAAEFGGDALISHEFFAAASGEQAARMVAALAPAEVHLVVTAREPLGLFTSSWQESLKNLGTTPLHEYSRTVSADPREVWNWRALDLGLVLGRWGATVPADRVHVITMPTPPADREELWERFCGVLALDPALCPPGSGFANESMGVVEAETLRRVNGRLSGSWPAYDRGRWIRSYLADRRLVPRGGERFWPDPDRVAECRERGERAVALVREHGYSVVGDLDSLLVPAVLPARRDPGSVTDGEVADVAVTLVAELLDDLRNRARVASAPKAEQAPRAGSGLRAPLRRVRRWRRG